MGADRPRLLAVTILTSMDQKTMKEVGIGGSPKTAGRETRATCQENRPSMAWSRRCRKPKPFARRAVASS